MKLFRYHDILRATEIIVSSNSVMTFHHIKWSNYLIRRKKIVPIFFPVFAIVLSSALTFFVLVVAACQIQLSQYLCQVAQCNFSQKLNYSHLKAWSQWQSNHTHSSLHRAISTEQQCLAWIVVGGKWNCKQTKKLSAEHKKKGTDINTNTHTHSRNT